MTAATRTICVEGLLSSSAEKIRKIHGSDDTLPSKEDLDELLATPGAIPEDLRVFDLVFPRVVTPGRTEGGGADRVTDDEIASIVWNGERWVRVNMLAGPRGWGYHGPDHFGVRARLVRFAS